MTTKIELLDKLTELEQRLEFVLIAASNDEINPQYSENIKVCHSLLLEVTTIIA